MQQNLEFNNYYKSSLIFLLITFGLLIKSSWLPIVISTLFFLLILDLIHLFTKNKLFSILISLSLIALIGVISFLTASYLSDNLDKLLKIDLGQYKDLLIKFGIKIPITVDSTFITKSLLTYIKNNISIIASLGANFLQILIGIILAVSFFANVNAAIPNNNWGKFIDAIKFYLNNIFNSFKTVMQIQILVAILNTLSLFLLSFLIAPIFTGDIMPYWYILLPLSFILSLVPVLGNVVINIIIFIVAINISLVFTIISIIYFFITNKLELVIIGKILGHRTNVPFLFIALSMFLGELIFSSLLGILFGIVSLLTIKSIMESFESERSISTKVLILEEE